MKHLPCPCCSDQRIWKTVEETLKPYDLEIKYCPVCGADVQVMKFLSRFQDTLKTVFPEIVMDENGKPLFQYRSPWSESTEGPKRMTYEMDLDKIDISREWEILEKYNKNK